MAKISLKVLSDNEIKDIHEASLLILRDTGVMVHHEQALRLLGEAGAKIDNSNNIARLPEKLVMDSVAKAGKQYILYGRDAECQTRFGYGDFVLMSSPGQYMWVDSQTNQRRAATIEDARAAIRLGDALENINIVGSMAQPEEVPESYRSVFLTAELVKGTGKPSRSWVYKGQAADYVLEIYRAIAGGKTALRDRPMIETFMEPISPLQLPKDGLDIIKKFVQAGQPVSIGPMAMTTGTAPGTLAGTLAQENAEILAGVVVTQLFAPGTAVTYGGIPHIMDPRTSICSFGSPEQGLMAVAMVQMARFYGFAVYINVGLTDAKVLDAQAGIEKGTSMLLGALAGADTFGHCGICGTDHSGSLSWLYVDNELAEYVKRIVRGFEVNADTLATDVVAAVGAKGSFLAEEHTAKHFRDELWLCRQVWTRQPFDNWQAEGGKSMADRIAEEVNRVLSTHKPAPIDEALAKEVDNIVKSAQRELG
ncbi:MAG: trimethylamine methyltransferase family protein [Planctomycetota bacterium]|nr:MAG: trimethylamine methyltransferase family protein [Planctomycetota bacterium]